MAKCKFHIFSSAYFASAVNRSQYVTDGKKEIAFIGRSNVGKSSLINSLTGRKKLAYVSREPGKTRTINYYAIQSRRIENEEEQRQDWYLVDLPGYGFAKVDKQEKLRWGKMMQDYFEQSDELRHVLCLVDIRHEPTEDDKQMNLFLRQMGIPFTVIATKADKISRGARQKQLAPICRALLVQPWEVICWSSEDGTGRDQLLTLLEKLLAPEEVPEA